MRIVVELDPPVARLAFEAIESGQFTDMDALASEAIQRLLASKGTASTRVDLSAWPTEAPPRFVNARFRTGASVPWVWGMVNRVFPLKVVVRVCGVLMTNAGRLGVPLHALHREAAASAMRIADVLRREDEEIGRQRTERRSVGLPQAGAKAEASRVRFAHHFVGRRSTDGIYTGGAFETGLLGVLDEADATVALTELGWKFAGLHNPVMDNPGDASARSNLTEEEARFYLLSIGREVPAEADAFSSVLTFLESGDRSTKQIREGVMPSTEHGSAKSVADTMRSGVLGRLTDLGAVERIKAGRGARYQITPLGREYIAATHREIPRE